MTTLKLMSAGLLVAAMFAAPALAAEGSAKARRIDVNDAYASTPAPASKKHGCVRAPDVGSFATAPWRKPPCEPASRY